MDNINMNEEQYKALYNKIKTDLYNEFINPETATYGLDVIRQQEAKDDIYKNIADEKEIIRDEIEQLKAVMKKYEEAEYVQIQSMILHFLEYDTQVFS